MTRYVIGSRDKPLAFEPRPLGSGPDPAYESHTSTFFCALYFALAVSSMGVDLTELTAVMTKELALNSSNAPVFP